MQHLSFILRHFLRTVPFHLRQIHTHTYIHTHTHTHIHNTHTHARTRARTHTHTHQAHEEIKQNCERWWRFSTIGMMFSANFQLGSRLWLLDHRNETLPINSTWALPILNTKFKRNPSSNSFRNETLNRRTQYLPLCLTNTLCSGNAKRQGQATSTPRAGFIVAIAHGWLNYSL